MASRYAPLGRSVRAALHSGGNSFRAAGGRTASSPPRAPSSGGRNPFGSDSSASRRSFTSYSRLPAELGCAVSLISLHNTVAAARLTSHLSINSRTCSALSQGVIVYEYELKIGWGKSVSLPSQALPAPPPGQMAVRSKEGNTVAWSGPDGPPPPAVTSQASELELESLHGLTRVVVHNTMGIF